MSNTNDPSNTYKAPWSFGIQGYDEQNQDYGVIEKPFSYTGPGHYENPSIYDADGNEVVGCDEYNVFSSPKNTRLLTAAPELLEALIEIFEDYKALADSGDAGCWSVEDLDCGKKAIAAIARATGGAA